MTVEGMIHSVQPSKSGKSLNVVVDGKRYQAKLDSGISQYVGKNVIFEAKSQSLQDGGMIWWINSAVLAPGQGSASAPNAGVSAPTSGPPSHLQPLVSNVAASLIAAGKTPQDLKGWVDACRLVLESTDEPAF